MTTPSTTTGYVCDTLPAPRLAGRVLSTTGASESSLRSPSPTSTSVLDPTTVPILDAETLEVVEHDDESPTTQASEETDVSFAPPGRKLCVRHQRMADEGTNLKLQRALDSLPIEERAAVNAIWSNFSASSHPRRALILHGLITMCCFSQLSLLAEQLAHIIRLDPFSVLPREVGLRVLSHLDATSLCRAAQVSRTWRDLADDDVLWRGICEQHIGTKCHKCGWGLPVLERRRTVFRIPSYSPATPSSSAPPSHTTIKRTLADIHLDTPPSKRARHTPVETPLPLMSVSPALPDSLPRSPSPANPLIVPTTPQPTVMITRPWKDVYCERLTIERNWRRGSCSVRTLKGHTDRVMCLQFAESLPHPSFPVLMSGSYDRTVRIWNLETGQEVRCLRGHTRAVRALQFDECKLITGAMDRTLKVWDWRTGRCVRTLEGHEDGVVALHFDATVLASGSVDTTVKVWNLQTGERFTLHGHRDWVNAVQLWDREQPVSTSSMPPTNWATSGGASSSSAGMDQGPPKINAGKMLFSASDDSTIRLWDLATRTCVQVFSGHVGQVQTIRLIPRDVGCGPAKLDLSAPPSAAHAAAHAVKGGSVSPPSSQTEGENPSHVGSSSTTPAGTPTTPLAPLLLSGSLDNTVRIWDVETGKVTKTLFGHIEGIWAAVSDKARLVTGSHDRTIKLWALDEGRCTSTLVGHRGAVTCLGLGEDKIVSGSDDGDIMVWSFGGST